MQPRAKQVELEQVQYELAATSRRHQVETASLRQRIADMELQAAEARKEADEYHRANLQSAAELTALANEVSDNCSRHRKIILTICFTVKENWVYLDASFIR